MSKAIESKKDNSKMQKQKIGFSSVQGGDDLDDFDISSNYLPFGDDSEEKDEEENKKSVAEDSLFPFDAISNSKARKRREKAKAKRRERIAKELESSQNFTIISAPTKNQAAYLVSQLTTEFKTFEDLDAVSIPPEQIITLPRELDPVSATSSTGIELLTQVLYRPVGMITRALDACSDKWWEADGELVPSRRSGCVIPILIVTMSASRGWELMNEIETYVKQKLGEQTGKSSESKKAEKSSERKEKKEAKKTPKDSSSASAMDSDKLAYSSQIVCCLYGKHTKVHEQAKEMRKKRYFCVGVGTPGRLLRLLEEKVPEGKKEGKGDKRSDLKYERSKEGLEKEKKKRSRYEEESEEEEKEEEEEGDGEKKQHSSEAESKPCANSLLRTDDVRLLVIDMFHNQKNFCIFTLGDTKGDIRRILSEHFLPNIVSGKTKVLLF